METLIGLTGDGFTIMAADCTTMRSIMILKDTEDKLLALDKFKLMGTVGEAGDRWGLSAHKRRDDHEVLLIHG